MTSGGVKDLSHPFNILHLWSKNLESLVLNRLKFWFGTGLTIHIFTPCCFSPGPLSLRARSTTGPPNIWKFAFQKFEDSSQPGASFSSNLLGEYLEMPARKGWGMLRDTNRGQQFCGVAESLPRTSGISRGETERELVTGAAGRFLRAVFLVVPLVVRHSQIKRTHKSNDIFKGGEKIFSKAASSRDAKNIQGNKGTQWKGQQSLCSPAMRSCSEWGQLRAGTRSKTHGAHPKNNNNNPHMAGFREPLGHMKAAGRQGKVSS